MKVYVAVRWLAYEGEDIIGVFDTLSAAAQRCRDESRDGDVPWKYRVEVRRLGVIESDESHDITT